MNKQSLNLKMLFIMMVPRAESLAWVGNYLEKLARKAISLIYEGRALRAWSVHMYVYIDPLAVQRKA